MKTISGHIADGAMAFLKAEYRILTYFVIVVGILLGIMGFSNANSHWSIGNSICCRSYFFSYSRFIGMKIATKSNVRTAEG